MHRLTEMATGSDKLILITGASGFVASAVISVFLECGYRGRGTVRSQESADKVARLFPRFQHQLSFGVVGDLAADGAFDEVVKDVDGVRAPSLPFKPETISHISI